MIAPEEASKKLPQISNESPRYPFPPSESRPLTNADYLKSNRPTLAASKRQSRIGYIIGRISIEIVCSLLVILAVIWGSIQLLGLLGLVGISNTPSALVHEAENSN